MPDILIKNLSPGLHRLLKEDAMRHHRSMAKHALALIEAGLESQGQAALPEPVSTQRPLTQDIIAAGIRQGRR